MPAATAYGLDYSARELRPTEIDSYNAGTQQKISFLIRYIGYPGNSKCISYYPGALERHEQSGRPVLLVHQVAYQDFAGGHDAGVQHARVAVADAERAGWAWNRPIFAALDRYLAASDPARGIHPISLDTARRYVAGFRSVLGDMAGLYGFYDVMGPAVRDGWVPWFWQCGAESALVEGVQFYQWNNGRVYPGGLECDLNKCYIDLGTALGADMQLTKENLQEIAQAVIDGIDRDKRATTRGLEGKNRSLYDLGIQTLWNSEDVLAAVFRIETRVAAGFSELSDDETTLLAAIRSAAGWPDDDTAPTTAQQKAALLRQLIPADVLAELVKAEPTAQA